MCCCSTEDVVPFRQAGSSIVVPSAVSPCCPLRMSDCFCTSYKKIKKACQHHTHPLSPSTNRTMEHLQTSPFLFPWASAISSHSTVQNWGGGAIVRPLSCPLIVPRRPLHGVHTPKHAHGELSSAEQRHTSTFSTSCSLKPLPSWSCTAEVNRVKRVSRPLGEWRDRRWSPLLAAAASFGARGNLVPIISISTVSISLADKHAGRIRCGSAEKDHSWSAAPETPLFYYLWQRKKAAGPEFKSQQKYIYIRVQLERAS